MKLILILITLIIIQISNIGLFAQNDEVAKNLRLVSYGKIDEVRAVIPDLLAKYPNDPGVKLLHGTILDDSFLALEVYQGILKNYPESQWADQAYWRIVQFYAVLGDTSKAQAELANFRSRYPASSLIAPAADVVRSSVNLSRKSLKNATSLTTNSPTLPKSTVTKPEIEAKPTPTPIPNVNKDAVINPEKNAASADLSENKVKTPPAPVTKLPTNGNNNIEKLNPGRNTPVAPIPQKPVVQPVTKPEVATKTENSDNIKSITQAESNVNVLKDTTSKAEPEFFGLQVGLYKDKSTAEAEKNRFLVRRLRTQVVEKDVEGTIMFAVVIGHYSSMSSAEEGKKIVSIQCGCDPIIYKK